MTDAHHSDRKGVEFALAHFVRPGSDHADFFSFAPSQPVTLYARQSRVSACHPCSLLMSFPRKRESTSSPPTIVGHRSRHRGLDPSISSTFHALFHFLICFSRRMASSMCSWTSK